VDKNFLASFPPEEELLKSSLTASGNVAIEADGHIHTPYSFSAFDNIDSLFELAVKEGVNVLGINDFYVTDGYDAFYRGCTANRVFPLFNIEFIGLMKAEQKSGIRINDPNNPGRVYFCGKGLDYPFHLGKDNSKVLFSLKEESQKHIKSVVDRLNILISVHYPSIKLDFNSVKNKYAMDLVRERHIARALRETAAVNFLTAAERIDFIESLYGGKKSEVSSDDYPALENEIRSNILKSGGTAFVPEDENSFPSVERIIEIITEAGGIPCYPVLLDDISGKCTEFESDVKKLHDSLAALGVGCIELIPGRNDHQQLEEFVQFFDKKGFIITFGTEHNTPGMLPLTVKARGSRELSRWLKQTSVTGVSVIAAHQYLRSRGETGYIDRNGRPRKRVKGQFEKLGRSVIQYYLRNR
jgi:hypothetical protein